MRTAFTKAGFSRVSFRVAQSERHIAFALSGLTVWTGVVLKTGNVYTWTAAFLALAVGFWCKNYPAKYQVTMLLRAGLLLAMAAVLQLGSVDSSMDTPYFFWTLAITTGYALLLTFPWALAISLVGLVLYLTSQHSWSSALMHAGWLAVWPATAMVFARSLQHTDLAFEHGLIDKGTGLYNASGLYVYGDELMAQFQRDKQPVSMLLIQCRNIDQIGEALGSKSVRKLLGNTVKTIAASSELTSNSIAARTDKGEFALLLPGLDAVRVKAFVRRHFGERPAIQLKVQERTANILLDTATVSANLQTPTCEHLYEAACTRLERKYRALEEGHAGKPGPRKTGPQPAVTALQSKPKSVTLKVLATQHKNKADKDKTPVTVPGFADSHTDSSLMSRLEPNSTLPLPLLHRAD